MKLRLAIAFMALSTLAAIALAVGGNLWIGFQPAGVSDRAVRAATIEQRFAVLRNRHSNRCSLAAASLVKMPGSGRLEGACCSLMDAGHYKQQVLGLKRYRAVAVVPADPYDVSVALAKRLISYQRQIHLRPARQRIYHQATWLADEHGPCCCHCWRWTAFEGQAKQLIARRRYDAAAVARLWDLEDGCGGPGGA
jgi:hypothetical protein